MIPPAFEYHAPRSVGEAIGLLGSLGPDAKLLAGGHSLLPMMKLRFAQPAHLIDLNRIPDLRGIREEGAEVVIAAGGVAMALLEKLGIHEVRPGVPILNGVTALVKTGEAAVKIARLHGGRFISKRLQYAPPGPEQIEEIRKYYGDVYPSVKA